MAPPHMTPRDGIAWITGGSSGIGEAVALELARRGWTVAVTARRLEALERLAADTEGAGRIVAHAGDVRDAASMRELVATIERVHGPIALAFLNAGLAPDARGIVDIEAIERAFAVNTLGVAKSLAAVLEPMRLRGRGQIAVNASIAGYGGLPGAAAYSASKAATIHLCEALRFDCVTAGIRLQVVNPGFVRTPLTAGKSVPMPLLMDVGDAARRTVDGFERGGFEIAFPRRLAWLARAVNLLPYPAYFALLGRLGGKGSGP